MLTRIEIDGFKSFDSFSLDLMPFCAVVGPNASGKSNLFDALRLLARVADKPTLSEAFQGLRGRASEQFREGADGQRSTFIRLAAECLLDPIVTDSFGREEAITHTRVRYEVHLERRIDDRAGSERIFVAHEAASPIAKGKDAWRKRAQPIVGPDSFRYQRTTPLLETEEKNGLRVIRARQDGGQGRPTPSGQATASFLSTITTAEQFKHLFALRQCLSSLVFLQLDPAAEREPSDFLARDVLEPDGRNIAAVLHRMKRTPPTPEQPRDLLAEVAGDLSSVIPAVRGIEVTANARAEQYELGIRMQDGQIFSSRVISDGTLRLLAVVTATSDPHRKGTLCLEEPENGVHPARLGPLVELLRDATRTYGDRHFQVLVSSHSIGVLDALQDHEIIGADVKTVFQPGGRPEYRTRMRTGVAAIGDLVEPERNLTRFEIDRVLRQPEDSKI
jgi:predicted ATPase